MSEKKKQIEREITRMTFVLPKRVDYTGYKSDTFIERFIVMCLHISRSGRSAWYSGCLNKKLVK